MPGMPKFDPFYAPYCARLKPRRLISPSKLRKSRLRSKTQEPESERESREIRYDSDECLQFLTQHRCYVIPTGEDSDEPTEKDKILCKTFLKGKWSCDFPMGTVFDEDTIQRTLARLVSKRESAIIRAIDELVVPSIDNSLQLDRLVGSGGESWNDMIPLDKDVVPVQQQSKDPMEKEYKCSPPVPRPAYSVGYSSRAFTYSQLLKLEPFLGGPNSTSFFRATAEMHFPFLVSEVKAPSLHIAE
ncbi:hypothetical protein BDW74DRAFT_142375 [Aspergillus multicolor]|uniref:uncharacterized protein n=1 Tax=Aspergillus multicolor TaxID=41759 RepID=UPI003CCD202B